MKNYFIIICIFFAPIFVFGQQVNSTVEKGEALIKYSVLKGEGIEAIASKFHVSSKKLLEINGLKSNAGLKESQEIKVPISSLLKPTCQGKNCVKIYYKVQAREGLYRIGKNFGDIKVSELKQLNKLKSESVSLGQQLLVGYLLQESVSSLNNKKESSSSNNGKAIINEIAENEDEVNNETGVSDLPFVKEKNIPPIIGQSASKKPMDKSSAPPTANGAYEGRGAFESQFIAGTTEWTSSASIFRTESGWNDGKYYVLTNTVAAGRVVKLINPQTNQILFAKVLGELPVIRGKDAIKIRVSNAAAAALGVEEEDEFELTVNY